jgi:hypothetical protein
MPYFKTYKDRTDAQKLAQMLAMQEANQAINTDYAPIPTMATPSASVDPQDLLKMREMMNRQTARNAQNIGKRTYSTTTPFNTGGLA